MKIKEELSSIGLKIFLKHVVSMFLTWSTSMICYFLWYGAPDHKLIMVFFMLQTQEIILYAS